MSTDFLKQAIEAENKATIRRKIVLITIGFILLVACVLTVRLWSQKHPEATQQPIVGSGDGSAIPLIETTTQAPEASNPETTTNAPQNNVKTSQKPTNQTYIPLPKPNGAVDHNAFVADMQQAITTYRHIVSLVGFSPNDSDEFKASRIRQAVALERQSFPAINPRTHLVNAGVTTGKYADLTTLCEDARAKVSVGLGSMEDWADDRSKTLYYSTGLGTVNQGVQLLVELSRQTSSL